MWTEPFVHRHLGWVLVQAKLYEEMEADVEAQVPKKNNLL